MRTFEFSVIFLALLASGSCFSKFDLMQMQFIRDWAASCVDQNLPPYDAQEIGPAIRKCDTERCIFLMYKYVADNRPEYFKLFDICFETNTRSHKVF